MYFSSTFFFRKITVKSPIKLPSWFDYVQVFGNMHSLTKSRFRRLIDIQLRAAHFFIQSHCLSIRHSVDMYHCYYNKKFETLLNLPFLTLSECLCFLFLTFRFMSCLLPTPLSYGYLHICKKNFPIAEVKTFRGLINFLNFLSVTNFLESHPTRHDLESDNTEFCVTCSVMHGTNMGGGRGCSLGCVTVSNALLRNTVVCSGVHDILSLKTVLYSSRLDVHILIWECVSCI